MMYPSLPISSFCSTGSGGTPSRANVGDYYGGTIPWVKSGELREEVILDTEEKITELAIKESSAKMVPKGALLIAMYGATIGRIAELGVEGTTNQAICHIVPDEKVADKRYLYYGLRFRVPELIALGAGGAQPNINQQIVRDTQIPLPLLPEQKRIAAILDKADSVRRKRQEAVRLTEELLRSVFLDMFGDPVTNPKVWPVLEFGELCEELRYGTSNMCTSDRQDNDLPVLRIPNVVGGLVNWEDMKYVQLPDTEVRRLVLEQGDMLFVRTNGNPEYIGRCAVFDDTRTTLYASYLIRARLKKDSPCLPQYASSCFTFPTYRKRLVAEAKTTAGNFNINTEGLKSLKLPVPPQSLQKKFITLRKRLEAVTIRFQTGVITSDTLFNSLLQRYFKGEM